LDLVAFILMLLHVSVFLVSEIFAAKSYCVECKCVRAFLPSSICKAEFVEL